MSILIDDFTSNLGPPINSYFTTRSFAGGASYSGGGVSVFGSGSIIYSGYNTNSVPACWSTFKVTHSGNDFYTIQISLLDSSDNTICQTNSIPGDISGTVTSVLATACNINCCLVDKIRIDASIQRGGCRIYYFDGIISRFCCLHPETQIKTQDGNKKIKDIRSTDFVYNEKNEAIQVLYNIKTYGAKDFIKIKKGFKNNLPTNDILITKGHPLLIGGKEFKCENLVDDDLVTRVSLETTPVYTIATRDRIFVQTEGLLVCTYSDEEWMRVHGYEGSKIKWTKLE